MGPHMQTPSLSSSFLGDYSTKSQSNTHLMLMAAVFPLGKLDHRRHCPLPLRTWLTSLPVVNKVINRFFKFDHFGNN
ncbi:hypothetical protein HanXRQr2_Chr17g0807451 [Helianthus annuus]|uniref:Uncharacterized protein n=1 Tax=Helianthus annuus TaxID=4232 RepID=A0A9K3DIT3_HELAN|nr:hypothetical protein HanXRQr2_Chr17g0807451 [Helianthus annuus]